MPPNVKVVELGLSNCNIDRQAYIYSGIARQQELFFNEISRASVCVSVKVDIN
jgi:hypothetical protein